MSDASKKMLEAMQVEAAFAILSPLRAVVFAEYMERKATAFVLTGASTEEIVEWKSMIRYMRVTVGGQPERSDT